MWCKNDFSMASYLSFMFGCTFLLCELIMNMAILITLALKWGKASIYIIFMFLASGSPFIYIWLNGLFVKFYSWLIPLFVTLDPILGPSISYYYVLNRQIEPYGRLQDFLKDNIWSHLLQLIGILLLQIVLIAVIDLIIYNRERFSRVNGKKMSTNTEVSGEELEVEEEGNPILQVVNTYYSFSKDSDEGLHEINIRVNKN
jgi:hypothetical protein